MENCRSKWYILGEREGSIEVKVNRIDGVVGRVGGSVVVVMRACCDGESVFWWSAQLK